jgi:hypothetical protein
MNSHLDELHERIDLACRSTNAATRERDRELAKVRWRLESDDGRCAGLDSFLCCALVKPEAALIFDGRDNELSKKKCYESALGIDLFIVLLD